MFKQRIRARAWLLGLATAGMLAAGATPAFSNTVLATTLKQGDTEVTVSPATTELACGEQGQVDILINDVTDLYGVDLIITFDPAVVKVVDSDPGPGINVRPGNFPDVSGGQGSIQFNAADNDVGTIKYVAIRERPAAGQTGSGTIISIQFEGVAAGTSEVKLSSVLLSNSQANPIPFTSTDGEITVTCDGTPTSPTRTPTRPSTGPTPTTPAGKVTATPPYGKPVYPTPGKPGSGGQGCTHVVKPGETLYGIAYQYGTTVYAIASANGITNPNFIAAGQTLVIPGCDGSGGPDPVPDGKCFSYTVQAGDTLSSIAYANGDTVVGLATRNGIVNPNLIFPGQVIQVCPGTGTGGGKPVYPSQPIATVPAVGKPVYPSQPIATPPYGKPVPPIGKPVPPIACSTWHVVKPGENLYRIAMYYGTTVHAIQVANGLADPNAIYAGQSLCIP